ncbi:DUF4097 family beta strand repeat protein [candidate division GN15 bacterium]|nr:DUF4097 family beta strand repeat protein [candidate division GN15 bacterium]
MYLRIVTGTLLAAVVILAWPAGTVAQAPVPLTEEVEASKPEKQDLPREAQRVAEEYLDVLEQLRAVLADYTTYMRELDPRKRQEITSELNRFTRRFEAGEYAANARDLTESLRKYIAVLREEEEQLAQTQVTVDQELQRTLRNLRRELVVIENLVDEDVLVDLSRLDESNEAIRTYVRAQLQELQAPSVEFLYRGSGSDDSIYVQVSGDSVGNSYVVVVPRAPTVPKPPRPPKMPGVRSPADQPTRSPTPAPSLMGLERTLTKAVAVTDFDKPVSITLEAGDVVITGSGGQSIEATLHIEVASSSRAKEKSFANGVSLALTNDRNSYTVGADFPTIRDPETQVLQTLLHLEVPDELPVLATNTFGKLTATGTRRSLEIRGDHSEIILVDCEGIIDVENTIGSIALTDVEGELEITNSYGTISFDDCRGELYVENMYGDVSLRDTDGEVSIKNSGAITVREHVGPLRIDNTNGIVDIADVRGNLVAFNTFQPLVIRDVEGDVRLENANASLTVSDVTGRADATNRFGAIRASHLSGPMRLRNENGSIDLTVDEQVYRQSTISALSGEVTIWIDEDADVTIQAETLEGTIASPFPMNLQDRGERQEATIRLGDGSGTLAVTGTNSSIAIKKRR